MSTYLLNIYWLLLGISIAAACTAVVVEATGRGDPARIRLLVPLSFCLMVLAGRWPSVVIPAQLNPDESLMLAQAIKFDVDLLPWRSMDPGTGGPVNTYVLLLMHWFGLPLSYPTARIAAIACACLTLVLGHAAMRRIGGARAASIAMLPAAAFFALSTDDNFVHYSSEQASLATISLMLFLVSRLDGRDRPEPAWLPVLIGLGAFVVAMSKVQGLPLAATLGVSLLAVVSTDVPSFLRRAALVAAGTLAATAVLLLVLALAGVLDDFHASFIQMPFQYASHPLSASDVNKLIKMRGESLGYFQWGMALVLLAALAFPLHADLRSRPWQAAIRFVGTLLVLAGLFLALSRPGKLFPHYTVYLGLALPWMLYYLLPWERRNTIPTGQPGRNAR